MERKLHALIHVSFLSVTACDTKNKKTIQYTLHTETMLLLLLLLLHTHVRAYTRSRAREIPITVCPIITICRLSQFLDFQRVRTLDNSC